MRPSSRPTDRGFLPGGGVPAGGPWPVGNLLVASVPCAPDLAPPEVFPQWGGPVAAPPEGAPPAAAPAAPWVAPTSAPPLAAPEGSFLSCSLGGMTLGTEEQRRRRWSRWGTERPDRRSSAVMRSNAEPEGLGSELNRVFTPTGYMSVQCLRGWGVNLNPVFTPTGYTGLHWMGQDTVCRNKSAQSKSVGERREQVGVVRNVNGNKSFKHRTRSNTETPRTLGHLSGGSQGWAGNRLEQDVDGGKSAQSGRRWRRELVGAVQNVQTCRRSPERRRRRRWWRRAAGVQHTGKTAAT